MSHDKLEQRQTNQQNTKEKDSKKDLLIEKNRDEVIYELLE